MTGIDRVIKIISLTSIKCLLCLKLGLSTWIDFSHTCATISQMYIDFTTDKIQIYLKMFAFTFQLL